MPNAAPPAESAAQNTSRLLSASAPNSSRSLSESVPPPHGALFSFGSAVGPSSTRRPSSSARELNNARPLRQVRTPPNVHSMQVPHTPHYFRFERRHFLLQRVRHHHLIGINHRPYRPNAHMSRMTRRGRGQVRHILLTQVRHYRMQHSNANMAHMLPGHHHQVRHLRLPNRLPNRVHKPRRMLHLPFKTTETTINSVSIEEIIFKRRTKAIFQKITSSRVVPENQTHPLVAEDQHRIGRESLRGI